MKELVTLNCFWCSSVVYLDTATPAETRGWHSSHKGSFCPDHIPESVADLRESYSKIVSRLAS